MIKIVKLLYVIIISVIFASSFTYADKIRGEYATKNIVGQDYYIKRCSSCHGDGARGGNMASIRGWKTLFEKDANELIQLHQDDHATVLLVNYFQSTSFQKEAPLMLKLLQEFAYDSENIPTCN